MNDSRLDELERRIARLESRVDGRIDEATAPQHTTHDAKPLMRALHDWRHEAEEQSLPGTVGYLGAAYVAGSEYLWARQHSLAELMPADWSPAAGILESLGSLPRLALLGALLREGRRTSADLQEALGGDQGETTSGQLYHHLRALQGAGLVAQRRRGEYEVPGQAVIAILTVLTAALNFATDPSIPPVGPHVAVPQSQ